LRIQGGRYLGHSQRSTYDREKSALKGAPLLHEGSPVITLTEGSSTQSLSTKKREDCLRLKSNQRRDTSYRKKAQKCPYQRGEKKGAPSGPGILSKGGKRARAMRARGPAIVGREICRSAKGGWRKRSNSEEKRGRRQAQSKRGWITSSKREKGGQPEVRLL